MRVDPEGDVHSIAIAVCQLRSDIFQQPQSTGSDAPDDYRPRTTPGVYVPTPIMRGPMWPNSIGVYSSWLGATESKWNGSVTVMAVIGAELAFAEAMRIVERLSWAD